MLPMDIFALKLKENWGIEFTIHPLVWAILALAGVGWYWWRRRALHAHWEPVEVKVPFGGIDVKIVPNYEVLKIAHQAWTELITRKAGLKFDENDDVIVEVYDSWYKLFGEIRTMIRTIPAHKLRESEDAQKLVEILLASLNEGLRPHLTRWQARFRRWYTAALAQHSDLSPQEVQRLYPQYQALVDDLKKVNDEMVKFAEQLQAIAQGRR